MNDQELLRRFGRLIALRTDRLCELVAGAMSVDPAIRQVVGPGRAAGRGPHPYRLSAHGRGTLIEAAARSHDRDGAWTDCRVAL